ncbi:hypothetical protein [Flavonifractor sp. HCP28S3_F3]|uniref:hypothetical protein n=1 Tax=Flavonifractor sp. HCP28S3_F3 TaxID=3438939 RepID=UPI003F8981B4
MKLLERAKSLIADSEVKEGTKDFLADAVSALLGDPVAAGKIMLSLMESPFFFQEKLFWQKFEMFIYGIDMNEEERAKFCAKLTEDGTKGDNPYRLLQAINHAETRRKVEFLINASRSLGAGFIDLATYFRICHAITNTMEEDLVFLSKHIQDKEDFGYSDIIQGLQNAGLMRQSVIDANGDDRFVFTPFADTLDQFAVSYNNVERYPMMGNTTAPSERSVGTKITQLDWEEIV